MFTEESYTRIPYKDIAYTIDTPIKSSPIQFTPTQPHSPAIPKSILKTSKDFNGQTPPPKARFVCFNSNVMLNDDCNTLTICESSGRIQSKSQNKYDTYLPKNLKIRPSKESNFLDVLLDDQIIDEDTFNTIKDYSTPPDQKIELLLRIKAQAPQSHHSEINNLIKYCKNNFRTIHNSNPINEPVVEHVVDPADIPIVDPAVEYNLIIKDYLNFKNAHIQELKQPSENSLEIFEQATKKIQKVNTIPQIYISTEDQSKIACSVITINATYPTALKKHLNKVQNIIKEKAGELLANNILEIPQDDVTLEQILDFIESSANLTKYSNDEIERTSTSLSTDSLNLVNAVREKLSRVYDLYYTKLYLPDKHRILDPIVKGSIDQSNVNNLINTLFALNELKLKYHDLLTNVYTKENKQLSNNCMKLQERIQYSLDKCISNYNNAKHKYLNIIKPNICKKNALCFA